MLKLVNSYSAIKKNEIMPFAATRMDLEIVILSEVSQTEKDKYHMISHMQNLKKNGTNEFIYKTEIEKVWSQSATSALDLRWVLIQKKPSMDYWRGLRLTKR